MGAVMLGVVLDLTEQVRHSPGADTCYAGDLLATAVGDSLHMVDEHLLHVGGSVRAIASAYAEDHGQAVAGPR
jgi:hypothetical protein